MHRNARLTGWARHELVSSGQPVPVATWIWPTKPSMGSPSGEIERQGRGACAHQYIRKPPLTLIVAPEM